MRYLITIYLSLFLLFSTLAKAEITPIEQKIVDYIHSQEKQQLFLLETLVNINSGTANIAGVHRVGEILRAHFEELGFNTFWVEEPDTMQRAGTLMAVRSGHKGKRLLLIGHLDTVFNSDSPFQHFKRFGKNAIGPGVIDDKGGDVVILYALKALNSLHALDDVSITVVLTGDEEDSGKPTSISRKPLIEAAHASDIALDFECAITQDTATVARRGISSWLIETEGNEAHSSEIFKKNGGDGAIFELVRILNTMRTQLTGEQYLSFNPGLILGGTSIQYDKQHSTATIFGKTNVIAKNAIVEGDLRFLMPEQRINAEKRMKSIVSEHLPGTTATITFQDGIPSMPPKAANLELLKLYSEVSLSLGYGPIKPLDPGLRGAGDISHIASFVTAALAGLGPVGTGAHSLKETLDISSLPIQTERAALLIYQLTHVES